MRSIRYFGNGTLKMVEAPEPEIKRADEVKIRVAYCGVCGSDLHFKRAELDFLFEGDEGTPIGHEATGVITELGPAATCKGLKVGDRVVYYYNEHCGSCYYCRNGQEQFCENMTGTSAAFSDYIVVREQSVHKLADTCSLKKGALIEPISVCLHGIDLIGIKPGQSVAISGGGTMGMIMTQLALHSGGTNITVIEPIAMKREMAKKLGAVHTIDPVNQDRKEEAMKITDGRGFDVVIEASGSWRACDGIEELVGKGGTLEFFAALYRHDYDYKLNLLNAFFKEIRIIGGVFQSPYAFPRSIALVNTLDLDPILEMDCVFTPENFEDAFEAQMNGRTIKSLVQFTPDVE
jgi:threonine dehydrogenase-like Zn-dependent dehydrogenase